jgi:hypothetical protein
MNFFFGMKHLNFHSEIQIPCFQNRNPKSKKLLLYEAWTENNQWVINRLNDCKLNNDFYIVKNNNINNKKIFFLANEKNIDQFNNKKLKNFNNFTDTAPAFRSNFKIFIKDGGFSSYQSEYPFSMVCKEGSIISSVSSIGNIDAEKNYIIIRNILEEPKEEKFNAYLVDIKEKKIKEKIEIKTNFTNFFELNSFLIKPEIFLITDKFLGVPIYMSIKNKHISFEHTHPPHEYILSKNKFEKITQLKKEIHEIIS